MDEKHLSWPSGIKRTKQRESVLSVLERSGAPLSAMEICKQTENEDSPVWLSTVYRILELFESENIVVKTSLSGSDMALYELDRNLHRHYAVCLNCRKIIEIGNCPFEKYTPEFAESDFKVLGHKLEIYGYCKKCREQK